MGAGELVSARNEVAHQIRLSQAIDTAKLVSLHRQSAIGASLHPAWKDLDPLWVSFFGVTMDERERARELFSLDDLGLILFNRELFSALLIHTSF